MKKIGFIGTGVMGQSIVKHLLNEGYEVAVYNRTKSKTEDLIRLGASWKDTPAEVARESELIFTMVGYPRDVEEVYYGNDGIFQTDFSNRTAVDLTTSTPSLAEKIYSTAVKAGGQALDAPVSGGDLGARNGTLTIMIGGESEVFESCRPVFELFSKSLEHHGPAGSGQHTKMANQIMVAGTMTGMTEMLVYAEKAELDLDKVVKTLSGGAAANWSLENYAPRIIKEDYTPGFFVKHFIKDLNIALQEADKMKLKLPATAKAKALYDQLAENGYEDEGTQALIRLWWG
jgi:3-hydroxyisobutyrate dehydrogenase